MIMDNLGLLVRFLV